MELIAEMKTQEPESSTSCKNMNKSSGRNFPIQCNHTDIYSLLPAVEGIFSWNDMSAVLPH